MKSTTNLQKEIYENQSLTDLPDEVWKKIPIFSGEYSASTLGRIKVADRVVKSGSHYMQLQERILKQFISNTGYLIVNLGGAIDHTSKQVHQLVAMAHLNHVPNGFITVVDHDDKNKLNNNKDNFNLVTNRRNSNQDHLDSSSKYTGVTKREWKNCISWEAGIYVNGKTIYLGVFDTEKEAGLYYKNALKSIDNGTEIQVKRKEYSSKVKGVYRIKQTNKWKARVGVNKNRIHIGTFNSEQEAIDAIIKYNITNKLL